ncbi:hypothetical protein [Actinomadura atramentaria]|uniref:hypothetical protein n=1 Tax=Actinomadura atramentaria TaxID=1990 RepID=UPI00036703D3|nr:hypothetical protein [Actinomadura atramentaria]
MSAQVSGDATAALAYLDRLADELRSRGWTVHVTAHGDRRPTADVLAPAPPGFSETVIAVPDGSGDARDWCFRFGWGERIGPCREPSRAARVLDASLAAHRAP